MSFLSDFKAFAMRGNVIDLAVAVVIGAAFGKIVSALVDGIIMPVIGLLLGGINVTGMSLTIGQASIKWGMFLQAVIDFAIISFVIFLMIKAISLLHKKEEAVPPKLSEEVVLLTEIRDLLRSKNNLS